MDRTRKNKKHEKGGEGGGVKEALSQLAWAMIKSRDVSIVQLTEVLIIMYVLLR